MDEVDVSMNRYVPQADDWTPVNIHSVLAQIVAQVSGRVFVGPELCHEPEYLEAALKFHHGDHRGACRHKEVGSNAQAISRQPTSRDQEVTREGAQSSQVV